MYTVQNTLDTYQAVCDGNKMRPRIHTRCRQMGGGGFVTPVQGVVSGWDWMGRGGMVGGGGEGEVH